MKRFSCLFLVGALSCFCAGCGQADSEPPAETEMEEDLESQEEMMKEMDGT
ncbi:MAG: hypothetical protein H8E44_09835 [Planctomycetes bacterium]|nr:hypothetical protein [Planctomycetota bacterium]MBL7038051.1 hypothetical protein [Pirellulaceae bacterium]